jgi:hypothetical protein
MNEDEKTSSLPFFLHFFNIININILGFDRPAATITTNTNNNNNININS